MDRRRNKRRQRQDILTEIRHAAALAALSRANKMVQTMIPMAEVRVPFTLDKPRVLIFNYNTIAKYEEISSKANGRDMFYWDTMMNLFEVQGKVAAAAVQQGKGQYAWVEVMRSLPMRELRFMLYAALHEYGARPTDPPTWPVDITLLSRYINPARTVDVLKAIVEGHQANSPTKEELEASLGPPEKTAGEDRPERAPGESGGTASFELLEDALA